MSGLGLVERRRKVHHVLAPVSQLVAAVKAKNGLVLRRFIYDNVDMPNVAQVGIHSSQFPDQVRDDLLNSLRNRSVNHKFHYDSVKQTQKWLALHQLYSPTRNDADCISIYEQSFEAAAAAMTLPQVHILGLGCGGGQKDTRLLKILARAGKQTSYTPCDVAAAMTLVARQAALEVVRADQCFPFACDLASAGDLPESLTVPPPTLLTFFGMIPNFEPEQILPKLAALVRSEDRLLFSANLAPGNDYAAGVNQILPQYDNPPTREWLLTFLLDLGVERGDGELRFSIEKVPANGLLRVVADFCFVQPRMICVEKNTFAFAAGDKIRLFFSYRHTPPRLRMLLEEHGLNVVEQWLAQSGEEGVFFCRRSG